KVRRFRLVIKITPRLKYFIKCNGPYLNCPTKCNRSNLSGIREKDKFLKDWTYYDFQYKIEYKAKEYDINVIKVKPQFTSSRCYRCGADRKSTRLNSSHVSISYAVFCLKKKK